MSGHGRMWKGRLVECGLEPTTLESANKQLIPLRHRARYGSPPFLPQGQILCALLVPKRGGGGWGDVCSLVVVTEGCRWTVACR